MMYSFSSDDVLIIKVKNVLYKTIKTIDNNNKLTSKVKNSLNLERKFLWIVITRLFFSVVVVAVFFFFFVFFFFGYLQIIKSS